MFIVFFLKIILRRKKKTTNSLLFLENFPIENSGYQYRAAKWTPYFEKEGYKVVVWTIEEDKSKFDYYLSKKRTAFLIKSMYKRFFQIIKSRKFETVIVRRELLLFNDYGNLFMEKFLLKIHPNAILDFDDDIAAAKKQPKEITSLYGRLLKEHGDKFNASLNLYNRFIVGSDYLKRLVLNRAPGTRPENVCVIPTCVDYDKYEPKVQFSEDGVIRFGWIGGDHNLFLLEKVIPFLNEIAQAHTIELIIVAGKNPNFITNFPQVFFSWSLEKEVVFLKYIDVGLMPVEDNKTGRGKCGFKLIQYMGLGIPAIASSVGANVEIVDNFQDSFLVEIESQWYKAMTNVISQKEEFNLIGEKARLKVLEKYTFASNVEKYINFINFINKSK